MQRRHFLHTLVPSLTAWSGLAMAQSKPPSIGDAADKTVILGQSAPFSGPAEQLGVQYRLGAQLYFEQVNERGGVHGRRIELQHIDDGYEPERCASNTKKLLAQDVFALFGYIGTSTSLAALPLATEAKVPFFAPFTGAQALREPFNRYAIHIRASYFDETAAIVNLIASAGIKKIAVFHQNDAYGEAGLAGMRRAMQPLGLEPYAIGKVERNSSDVAAALEAIMAKRPEAIVQISAYKSCASFIRQARQKGFVGNFYNLSFVGTQALLEELGAMAKGVVVSQVMPFPYTPVTELSKEYLTAVNANQGMRANYSSMEGYVAAKVFTEVLQRTGRNLSREGFIDTLQGINRLNLGGFPLEFGPNKHTGSKLVELTMLTEDGKVRR